MPYSPGTENRSGELLGAGIRQGGQNVLNLLMQMFSGMQAKDTAAKEKTSRGLQARSALAKLDPDNADKYNAMSSDEALGTASVLPEYLKQREIAKAQSATQGFLKDYGRNTAPTVKPMMGAWIDLVNGGDGGITPGMNPRDAVMSAISKNPGAVTTPVGQEALVAALKAGMTPSRGNFQPINMNGVNGIVDPVTGKMVQARAAASTTARNTPPALDEGEEWIQVKTKDGKTIPGLYHAVNKDGKRTGKQWYDPQSATRGVSLFGDAGGTPAAPGAAPVPDNDPLGILSP